MKGSEGRDGGERLFQVKEIHMQNPKARGDMMCATEPLRKCGGDS